jgi:hypothetical protein
MLFGAAYKTTLAEKADTVRGTTAPARSGPPGD